VRNNVCSNQFIQWCRLYESIMFYNKWRQAKTERGVSGRGRKRERERGTD
jgi:hypothetical protein